MQIPILLNHEPSKAIGWTEIVDGQLQFVMAADSQITLDMAFQVFGNAGLQVLEATEEDGVMMIRRGRILEWSVAPEAATPCGAKR
jgi:hypothetical protein